QQFVILAGAINRTSTGEDKAPDTAAFRHFGDRARGHQVDLNRQVAIQRARGIADDRAEMNNGVDTLHALDDLAYFAEIRLGDFEIRMVDDAFDWFSAIEQTIQHAHAMAAGEQFR